jgi:two-component system chemotaxis response regulator CheB
MIRCLVVDDSRTFRAVLRTILAAAKDVQVVGEASDGEEAIAKALELRPDVITMDVRMPRRDGLEALREIMRVAPTPVVVVSAAGEEAEVGFEALRLGAVEVLPKPRAEDPRGFERDADGIRMAVRAVSGLRLATRHRERRERAARQVASRGIEVVGITSSTGGPAALAKIFAATPANFPLPVLLVQHIHAGFDASFARWLATTTGWRVRLAEGGDRPEPGAVLVAPAERHMKIVRGRVVLDAGPPVKSCRPSGNVLFDSLAVEYGAGAAGFVLTGMGEDGAAGLKRMRDAGAATYAQGQGTCVVYGMPRAANELGAVQSMLELDEIPSALQQIAAAAAAASRTGSA